MNVAVHLISMPWSTPEIPSIQLGVLKAHLDNAFGPKLRTQTYSAFNAIVSPSRRSRRDLYQELADFDEFPYFLLCVERLVEPAAGIERRHVRDVLKRLNDCDEIEAQIDRGGLALIEERTNDYIDRVIVPQLEADALNLIGFTLNYSQLYSSLYCARRLQQQCAERRLLFVFGGATVVYPGTVSVMRRFVSGVCVAGEGEQKLEMVVRACQSAQDCEPQALISEVASLDRGIFDIHDSNLNLHELDRTMLKSQVAEIDSLPPPDFEEYFRSIRDRSRTPKQHAEARHEAWLAFEGSRGCFAKCDFCDVHTNWDGFRRGSAERIVREVSTLALRHRCDKVAFMDNVCDTWASQYADLLISRGMKIRAFMELRVHHPEIFWTKLALCGVEEVQVGVEAVVQDLLERMKKGTHAKDNLLVHKWLRELGIQSNSNLISHHPKSTLQHVRDTKEIVRAIPHLDRFTFSNFALLLGSPVDQELSAEQRRRLEERTPIRIPRAMRGYFTLKGEYNLPPHSYDRRVMDAWTELEAWENQSFRERTWEPFMTVRRVGEALLLQDGREKRMKEYCLDGATAEIYEQCHRGATVPKLAQACGLAPSETASITNQLLEDRLVTRIGDCLIALALRPRDELFGNLMRRSSTSHPSAEVGIKRVGLHVV